jgi:hypothetical protein
VKGLDSSGIIWSKETHVMFFNYLAVFS